MPEIRFLIRGDAAELIAALRATDQAREVTEEGFANLGTVGSQAAAEAGTALEGLGEKAAEVSRQATMAEQALEAVGGDPRKALMAANGDMERTIALLAGVQQSTQQLAQADSLRGFAKSAATGKVRLEELKATVDRLGEQATPELRQELARLEAQFAETFDRGKKEVGQLADEIGDVSTQARTLGGDTFDLRDVFETAFPSMAGNVLKVASAVGVAVAAFKGTREAIKFLKDNGIVDIDALTSRILFHGQSVDEIADKYNKLRRGFTEARQESENLTNMIRILDNLGIEHAGTIEDVTNKYEAWVATRRGVGDMLTEQSRAMKEFTKEVTGFTPESFKKGLSEILALSVELREKGLLADDSPFSEAFRAQINSFGTTFDKYGASVASGVPAEALARFAALRKELQDTGPSADVAHAAITRFLTEVAKNGLPASETMRNFAGALGETRDTSTDAQAALVTYVAEVLAAEKANASTSASARSHAEASVAFTKSQEEAERAVARYVKVVRESGSESDVAKEALKQMDAALASLAAAAIAADKAQTAHSETLKKLKVEADGAVQSYLDLVNAQSRAADAPGPRSATRAGDDRQSASLGGAKDELAALVAERDRLETLELTSDETFAQLDAVNAKIGELGDAQRALARQSQQGEIGVVYEQMGLDVGEVKTAMDAARGAAKQLADQIIAAGGTTTDVARLVGGISGLADAWEINNKNIGKTREEFDIVKGELAAFLTGAQSQVESFGQIQRQAFDGAPIREFAIGTSSEVSNLRETFSRFSTNAKGEITGVVTELAQGSTAFLTNLSAAQEQAASAVKTSTQQTRTSLEESGADFGVFGEVVLASGEKGDIVYDRLTRTISNTGKETDALAETTDKAGSKIEDLGTKTKEVEDKVSASTQSAKGHFETFGKTATEVYRAILEEAGKFTDELRDQIRLAQELGEALNVAGGAEAGPGVGP